MIRFSLVVESAVLFHDCDDALNLALILIAGSR
jgi:hypothetical protein